MKAIICTILLCGTAIFCTIRFTAPHFAGAKHHYQMHVDAVGNIMRLDTVTGRLHYFGRNGAWEMAENWQPPATPAPQVASNSKGGIDFEPEASPTVSPAAP